MSAKKGKFLAQKNQKPNPRKIDLSNKQDQLIVEAYILSIIASKAAKQAKCEEQLREGMHIPNSSIEQDGIQVEAFAGVANLSAKDRKELEASIRSISAMNKNFLKDLRSPDNQGSPSLLHIYFDNPTQENFKKLSSSTRKALQTVEVSRRIAILKRTKNNLDFKNNMSQGYALSDGQITTLERKLSEDVPELKPATSDTEKHYRSEKGAINKVWAKRLLTIALAAALGVGAWHTGNNLVHDTSAVIESNQQTHDNLVSKGLDYTDFNIPSQTYVNLINASLNLESYQTKQPTYEEQLALVDSMLTSYDSAVTSKISAAYTQANPGVEISGIKYSDKEVTLTVSENGEASTKVIKISDFLFQQTNLSDLIKASSELTAIRSNIVQDQGTHETIYSPDPDTSSTAPTTEYDLTNKTQARMQKLQTLHQRAMNATALGLMYRDNWFMQDQFITIPQELPEISTTEPETNAPVIETAPREEVSPIFTEASIKNKNLITHFSQFFAREHNLNNPYSSVSSHDITINQSNQNYAYLVTVDGKSFILTHGSYPTGVENFLQSEADKGTLSFTRTDAIEVTQAYTHGNFRDDNGNYQSTKMVDGAAKYDGNILPVISGNGNFRSQCFDTTRESLLANKLLFEAISAALNVYSPYPKNDYHIDGWKEEYLQGLNAYAQQCGYSAKDFSSILTGIEDPESERE